MTWPVMWPAVLGEQSQAIALATSVVSPIRRSAIVAVTGRRAPGVRSDAVMGDTVQPGATTFDAGARGGADDLVLEREREAVGIAALAAA